MGHETYSFTSPPEEGMLRIFTPESRLGHPICVEWRHEVSVSPFPRKITRTGTPLMTALTIIRKKLRWEDDASPNKHYVLARAELRRLAVTVAHRHIRPSRRNCRSIKNTITHN